MLKKIHNSVRSNKGIKQKDHLEYGVDSKHRHNLQKYKLQQLEISAHILLTAINSNYPEIIYRT